MIHRGVEVDAIILRATLNFDLAERLIPDTTTLRFHSVKVPIGNLSSQVVSGLVNTDERRADLDLDLFPSCRGKSYITAHTMTTLMVTPGMNIVILPGSGGRKGFAELNDKVAFEVRKLRA